MPVYFFFFFFSSRRRHTRSKRDWSSDVCSSDLSGDRTVTQEAGYDEIYPPGPGREIAERTCMICHGENFLSTPPATVGTWNLRLDRMMGKNLFDKAPASYAEGLLTYRASELQFSRE